MMKNKKWVMIAGSFILAAVQILGSIPAHALSIQHFSSVPSTGFNAVLPSIGTQNIVETAFAFLPRFDSALGTLQRVDISGSIDSQGTLRVSSCNESFATAQKTCTTRLNNASHQWQASAGGDIVAIGSRGFSDLVRCTTSGGLLASVCSRSEPLNSPLLSTNFTFLPTHGLFSNFVGSGNVTVRGAFRGTASVFGVAATPAGRVSGTMSGTARVIYTFDPPAPPPPPPAAIPEPSTMLLFGSGIAGLIGWRYRKKLYA